MTVVFEKKMGHALIIVYKIEHDNEYYLQGIDFTDFDKKEFEGITNPLKKRQWLASRYWLKKISNQQRTLFLEKSHLGKPHIINHKSFFSISHSKDIIAIIWSEEREVSIDIEHFQEKILHLKNKFLHPLDFSHEADVEVMTLIWSAKETIYKYFHDRSLYSFKENIAIYKRDENGVYFNLTSQPVEQRNIVLFQRMDNFVLTWIC